MSINSFAKNAIQILIYLFKIIDFNPIYKSYIVRARNFEILDLENKQINVKQFFQKNFQFSNLIFKFDSNELDKDKCRGFNLEGDAIDLDLEKTETFIEIVFPGNLDT